MTAMKLILMASLVLLMNIAVISIPEDACAGHGCNTSIQCFSNTCSDYTDQELHTLCLGMCQVHGGPSCCNTGHPKCRDECAGEVRLVCKCERPCP